MADLHDLAVSIGWGTAATNADEVLLLDDATFGKLDSNVLGLPYGTKHVPAAITSFMQTARWFRGRRNEFEEPRAGWVKLRLKDADSSFDPLNTGSDYSVSMGAPIQLTYGTAPLGEFYVQDIDAEHVKGATLTYVDVQGTDRLAVLATDMDTIGSAHSGDLTGARIDRVLDAAEINWQGSRNIDAGLSTLVATTFGESALRHLQKVVRTERGQLFVDATGAIRFSARHSNANAEPAATFSDNGTGIPYTRMKQKAGSELFWNRAKVSADGTDYTAEDSASITATGLTRTKTLATEGNSAAIAQAVADDIVARFANSSRSVFDSVTVFVNSLTAAQRVTVLALDIGDRIAVTRTPPGASEVTKNHTIQGIGGFSDTEQVDLTFVLTEDTGTAVFVLDDGVFGVLDTGPGRLTF